MSDNNSNNMILCFVYSPKKKLTQYLTQQATNALTFLTTKFLRLGVGIFSAPRKSCRYKLKARVLICGGIGFAGDPPDNIVRRCCL